MLFHIQATTYTLLMLSRVHMRPLVHCMHYENDTNHIFLYKEVICPPTNKKITIKATTYRGFLGASSPHPDTALLGLSGGVPPR